GAQDSISVRFGTGAGQFESRDNAEVPTCGQPERVVLDDIDGDDHLAAVVTCLAGAVDVFLGDGSGALTRSDAHALERPGARDAALADVDADGFLDMAVTHCGAPPCGVVVYLGSPEGWTESFAAEVP